MIAVSIKNTRSNGIPDVGTANLRRNRHFVEHNTTNGHGIFHVKQGVSDLADEKLTGICLQPITEI